MMKLAHDIFLFDFIFSSPSKDVAAALDPLLVCLQHFHPASFCSLLDLYLCFPPPVNLDLAAQQMKHSVATPKQ